MAVFGEVLPKSFSENVHKIIKYDLAYVMGTSLIIQPFASLIDIVPSNIHLVCINKENYNISRENFLLIDGNLDD